MNKLIGCILIFFNLGCATYQTHVSHLRREIRAGYFNNAESSLKHRAYTQDRDQLAYLLDYATVLQIQKKYKESSDAFILADRLIEEMDYHSISNITMATLGSEEMIQYKGDSYEKMLINCMNALNFLMLDRHDEAMVEVRRINQKVRLFQNEGKKYFELNPFAHYLAGLIWESDKKYDDAYIDFEKAYELGMRHQYLYEDLIRTARLSKRTEQYSNWKKRFPEVQEKPEWYSKKYSELIVLHQVGWGPEKHFSDADVRFPELYPVNSETTSARVYLNGVLQKDAESIYDIESVAIQTFKEDLSWMIARKMAAIVAKEVMADEIDKKNEGWGLLARIIMRVSDRADLRQWSTLPQKFSLIKVWLPVGEYDLELKSTNIYGLETQETSGLQKIALHPKHKAFFSWRSLR